jgi:hypothetical protein
MFSPRNLIILKGKPCFNIDVTNNPKREKKQQKQQPIELQNTAGWEIDAANYCCISLRETQSYKE